MRFYAVMIALALTSYAAADEKALVRSLDLKGVKLNHDGNEPKPIEIKSAEELAKAKVFLDDDGRAAIKKQVDFTKEKLVVFAWSGSGGDKLAPGVKEDGKKVTAAFTYTAGLTDDLRRHGHAFAVAKDVVVEVKK